jgi:hypothetical protein
MPGVAIEWVHRDARGAVDRAASQRAAAQMVQAFDMNDAAALHSRHTQGRAIDMTIRWSGELRIRDATGRLVTIRSTPRNGLNRELDAVGATFGVIKAIRRRDRPHWSDDGH